MAEEILGKLKSWLSSYPHWEDFCLLPRAWEEISRRKDVMGNAWLGCRCYVTLFWEMEGADNDAENARRLLEFQNWVSEQCVLGLAPKFGDVSFGERIWTEKGGYTPAAQSVTYTATLVTEFVKAHTVK